MSKLVLANVKLEDSGIYRCEAENSYGRSDQSLEMSVLGKCRTVPSAGTIIIGFCHAEALQQLKNLPYISKI
jgi:hypothetical protein